MVKSPSPMRMLFEWTCMVSQTQWQEVQIATAANFTISSPHSSILSLENGEPLGYMPAAISDISNSVGENPLHQRSNQVLKVIITTSQAAAILRQLQVTTFIASSPGYVGEDISSADRGGRSGHCCGLLEQSIRGVERLEGIEEHQHMH